jgi:hypothetical protein
MFGPKDEGAGAGIIAGSAIQKSKVILRSSLARPQTARKAKRRCADASSTIPPTLRRSSFFDKPWRSMPPPKSRYRPLGRSLPSASARAQQPLAIALRGEVAAMRLRLSFRRRMPALGKEAHHAVGPAGRVAAWTSPVDAGWGAGARRGCCRHRQNVDWRLADAVTAALDGADLLTSAFGALSVVERAIKIGQPGERINAWRCRRHAGRWSQAPDPSDGARLHHRC